MLISSFRKKISNVNSQLLKEINIEILFRNLEHVLTFVHLYIYFVKFCGRNFAYGALWLVNRQCLQTSIWSVDDLGFRKFSSSV